MRQSTAIKMKEYSVFKIVKARRGWVLLHGPQYAMATDSSRLIGFIMYIRTYMNSYNKHWRNTRCIQYVRRLCRTLYMIL